MDVKTVYNCWMGQLLAALLINSWFTILLLKYSSASQAFPKQYCIIYLIVFQVDVGKHVPEYV